MVLNEQTNGYTVPATFYTHTMHNNVNELLIIDSIGLKVNSLI